MDRQDKNRLAELIEQLPEGEIQAAVRYLEYLKDRGDPYLKFLMSVPEEDEELTDEFQRELDRAWKDINDGQVISSDQLKQEAGLSVYSRRQACNFSLASVTSRRAVKRSTVTPSAEVGRGTPAWVGSSVPF